MFDAQDADMAGNEAGDGRAASEDAAPDDASGGSAGDETGDAGNHPDASLWPYPAFQAVAAMQAVALVARACAGEQGLHAAMTGVLAATAAATLAMSVATAMRSVRRHARGTAPLVALLVAWHVALAVVLAPSVPTLGEFFPDGNPYSGSLGNQCSAHFVVGEEFAMEGTMGGDGVTIRALEGETIRTPDVVPRAGLTFVGWVYGGCGEPDVAPGGLIYLDSNGTDNNSVTLFAEFVDSDGHMWGACGKHEEPNEWSEGEAASNLRPLLVGLGLGALAVVAVAAALPALRRGGEEVG